MQMTYICNTFETCNTNIKHMIVTCTTCNMHMRIQDSATVCTYIHTYIGTC